MFYLTIMAYLSKDLAEVEKLLTWTGIILLMSKMQSLVSVVLCFMSNTIVEHINNTVFKSVHVAGKIMT